MSDFLANLENDTWFHRMDPRIKLLYLLVLSVINLFFLDSRFLFLILLSTIPFWIMARVNIRPLLPQLTAITLFLLSLMIFIYGFSGSISLVAAGGEQMEGLFIQIGPIRMYLNAANLGLVQILRMATPMLTSLLIFSTTDPTMFARGLTKMRVPYSVSFMLLGALKMLPLVMDEAQNITDAQKIRGVSSKGPLNRFKATKLLMFPLLINTLSKSRSMGLAVECKAFGSESERTYFRDLKISRKDTPFILWILIFAAVMLYIRFGLGLGWGKAF